MDFSRGGNHGRRTSRTETADPIAESVLRRDAAAIVAGHPRRGRLEPVRARLQQDHDRADGCLAEGICRSRLRPAGLVLVGCRLVVETFGGICIILGLFTRLAAAAAAIEMLCIFVVYWGNGCGWTKRGYEYVLMWGLISFAIALRGGGPYSLDRKIGREL